MAGECKASIAGAAQSGRGAAFRGRRPGALDSALTMPPKPRQIRIEQTGALAAMQALQDRSDEELEREQKFKAAALAILGARAAERYDADAARDYFRRAIAASRPQERMQLRRMADASLALAERRPDDLKAAVERLGQAPPSNRQLLLLRLMGFLAPPANAPWYLKARGFVIILLLVIVLLAHRLRDRQARVAALRRSRHPGQRPARASSSSPRSSACSPCSGAGDRRPPARRRAPPRAADVCGRYSLASPDPARLRERFAIGDDVPVRARYNVAPGDDVLTVTTDREGAPRGELLRWGLVPYWAKDPKTLGLKLINARSETMLTNGAFRDARRCLVIADGFYEWEKRPGEPKQPWWVTRPDHEPFAFAGLWSSWRPADGVEPLRSVAIVTTAASEQLAHVHDRMPVMLAPEAEDAWLDRATEPAELLELCAPLEQTGMRAVGDAVNDARHDEADCLEPALPRLTLF